MTFKELKNNFCDAMVKATVKRRLRQSYNACLVEDAMKLVPIMLEQLSPMKKEFLTAKKLNRIVIASDVPSNVGYVNGLGYAKELLDEGRYNLNSLKEVMGLLPNSYACNAFSPTYAIGFFNGLFGGDDCDRYMSYGMDSNRFTIEWKRILLKDFSLKTAS